MLMGSERASKFHYSGNRPTEEIRIAEPAWLGQLDPKELLVFIHLPKTGGTSLNSILWQVYGRHFLSYHPTMSDWSPTAIGRGKASSVLATGGHVPFGFHRKFGRPYHKWIYGRDGVFAGRQVRYLSIVRNPIDRMGSLYHFVTTFPAHRHYKATKNMVPEEFFDFMEKETPDVITNRQCRRLCGTSVKGRRFGDLKQMIIDNYYSIGVLERFEDFVDDLKHSFNWPDSFEVKRLNASPRGNNANEFSGSLLQRLAALNSIDMDLYEFVRDHADEFIK